MTNHNKRLDEILDYYAAERSKLANSEEELERFKASAFRHFMQWINGQDDEDHAVAVFFNIQAYEYTKQKIEKNEKMLRKYK